MYRALSVKFLWDSDIHSSRPLTLLALFIITVSVTGCKVQLYSELQEQEGNEILALLLSNNMQSEKKPGKDQVISIYVEEDQLAEAVELLRRNGYPKDEFSTVKDIFKQEGLISTPFEERARYVYALSQEMAETLSQVDGVMSARVHVVLPQQSSKRSSAALKPSSAAVFIKYNPSYEYQIKNSVPQMKTMVQNGIEGLLYDRVSVSMFPAQDEDILKLCPDLINILSIDVTASTLGRFHTLIFGYGIVLLFSLGFGGFFFFRYRQLAAQLGMMPEGPIQEGDSGKSSENKP